MEYISFGGHDSTHNKCTLHRLEEAAMGQLLGVPLFNIIPKMCLPSTRHFARMGWTLEQET